MKKVRMIKLFTCQLVLGRKALDVLAASGDFATSEEITSARRALDGIGGQSRIFTEEQFEVIHTAMSFLETKHLNEITADHPGDTSYKDFILHGKYMDMCQKFGTNYNM